MSIESKKIKIGDLEIVTIKKDIKNLHLGVYPPHDQVRIAAPLKTSYDAIRLFAISKLSWIKKQKKKFEEQEKEAERKYINRETHYFLGKKYLLNVVEQSKPERIEIKKRSQIDLHVYSKEFQERKKRIMEKWYREKLYEISVPIVKKFETKLKIKINDLKIRKMKSKWGTYNRTKNTISLNIELAKKPLRCLEYVIAHEMIHFFERNHNSNFIKKLRSLIKNWESIKSELNYYPLGFEIWKEENTSKKKFL